jgi:hypothetical protein
LLRVLTDLYVQKLHHTADEERRYTELALRLLDAVDVSTRVAVASRFAHHLSPPPRVLHRLAGDQPQVASALRAHPSLQSPAPAEDVAPPPAVMTVAEAEAPNEAESGEPESDDAEPFVAAPQSLDIATADQLNELFFTADANERRLILLNLEIVAPLQSERAGVWRDRTIGERLEAAALGHRREEFAQLLVRALHIPRDQAQRIMRDDLGEPLVAAGKALGIAREVLYRILMFVNPIVGHSVERVHALAELYDEITPQAAEGMVAIWQALEKRERKPPTYQPFTRDDGTLPHARPATAMQSAPAAQRPSERRGVS